MKAFLYSPILLIMVLLIPSCEPEDDTLIEVTQKPVVGFEIMQITGNEIIAWAAIDLSQEAFDSISLPQGWFKNQPRELMFDSGEFARSPNDTIDGELKQEEHFGHVWKHVASVIEWNIELDEQGLLSGNLINKYHKITFKAGRKLKILTSPEGDRYVLLTRDFNRFSDETSLPDSWQQKDSVIMEDLTIQLPNPTMNIRTDNEDSYQGPI